MSDLTIAAIVDRLNAEAFGKPLVTNSLRSMVVEAMLAMALPAGWRWCGADWAGWDLEHQDGTRLEVKQSAARQTWPAPKHSSSPVFDIRQRSGWWDGAVWTEKAGRHADIYAFAHHPVADDSADHRDPAQWVFYIVATGTLPDSKSLSLRRLRTLTQGLQIGGAVTRIESLRRLARLGGSEPDLVAPPRRTTEALNE